MKKKETIQKIRRHLQSPMQRSAYAHAIRYISLSMAIILAASPQLGKLTGLDFISNPVYAVYDGLSDIMSSSETDKESQESELKEVALTTPTTIVVPVTSITTTTTTITTTTVVTTEEPTEPTTEEVVEETEEINYEEEDVYEEEYDYYEEDEYEEEDTYSGSYSGYYTAKYYEGSVGSYGYSGRDLISGYSVASPDFPQGTILYITGGGLDGQYRVDDTGCPSGVIDFFFFYGDVPSGFVYDGVYSIEVSVIG